MPKNQKELAPRSGATRGQSLIELLIAMGVFVLAVSAITFLILDAYIADRAGHERTKASFLAEEGLEAAKSIRDNDWDDLTVGDHGLTISGSSWAFQGTEEDLSDQLKEGERKITIEGVDSNRKKVTSQVAWELTETRLQDVSLVTYLTDWRAGAEEPEEPEFESCSDYCESLDYENGECKQNENKCNQAGGIYESGGDDYCSPPNDACCCF